MSTEERFIGDFPKQCKICDDELPEGRSDEICEDCRRFRTIYKRSMRPKITAATTPATFVQISS